MEAKLVFQQEPRGTPALRRGWHTPDPSPTRSAHDLPGCKTSWVVTEQEAEDEEGQRRPSPRGSKSSCQPPTTCRDAWVPNPWDQERRTDVEDEFTRSPSPSDAGDVKSESKVDDSPGSRYDWDENGEKVETPRGHPASTMAGTVELKILPKWRANEAEQAAPKKQLEKVPKKQQETQAAQMQEETGARERTPSPEPTLLPRDAHVVAAQSPLAPSAWTVRPTLVGIPPPPPSMPPIFPSSVQTPYGYFLAGLAPPTHPPVSKEAARKQRQQRAQSGRAAEEEASRKGSRGGAAPRSAQGAPTGGAAKNAAGGHHATYTAGVAGQASPWQRGSNALLLQPPMGQQRPYANSSPAEAEGPSSAPFILSMGSVGHPYYCKEACKYATKRRGCKDGADCDRCHLCVWKRYGH